MPDRPLEEEGRWEKDDDDTMAPVDLLEGRRRDMAMLGRSGEEVKYSGADSAKGVRGSSGP